MAENGEYCKMWEALGLDLDAHDALLSVIPPYYQEVYLSQEGRPKGMEYFDFVVMEIHGLRIKELQEHKEKGGKVIGSFCLYAPEEIITGAGAINIGLCAGADVGGEAAEKYLPRNICPLIKSFFGFKVARICPYFESCDLVVGETTCDGKKKAFEQLNELVPVHVMETPQMKRERDRLMWRQEVREFVDVVEGVTGVPLSGEGLKAAIERTNRKRRALQRLNELRKSEPVPISGKDCLLIEQIAFYDDPVRFTAKVEELCDELDERVAKGEGIAPAGTKRILLSGCPMAIPNWKMHHVIETSGAVVVGEESCIGWRYFRDLVDEEAAGLEAMLDSVADRYMKIDCACFTPNEERMEHIPQLVDGTASDGVIHYALQFCGPYTVEYASVKKVLDAKGTPVLRIETDYGQEDVGQLKTRVEAFLEML